MGEMVAEVLLMVSAIIVAIGIVAGAVFKVYKVASRIDAALGVDKQGRTLAARMDDVEHELFPNKGSSIKDQVTRLEHAQGEQSAELRVVRDLLTILVEHRS